MYENIFFLIKHLFKNISTYCIVNNYADLENYTILLITDDEFALGFIHRALENNLLQGYGLRPGSVASIQVVRAEDQPNCRAAIALFQELTAVEAEAQCVPSMSNKLLF